MRRRRYLRAVGVVAVGGLAGCVGIAPTRDDTDGSKETTDGDAPDWPSGPYADSESTRVTVEDGESGAVLGTVRAAIAASTEDRYLGLSDAASLPEDAGMLFVYDAPRESLTYVMREMDFGIDIVYVDGERTITQIHHAPEPGPNEDGTEQRYPGSGQYVLEVPYEWTDRNGVEVGDSLAFDL